MGGQFSSPSWQWLENGQRLHLQHGPIDLIIQATGENHETAKAYQQAHACFESVLTDLVAELEYLRTPLSRTSCSSTFNSAESGNQISETFVQESVTQQSENLTQPPLVEPVAKRMVNAAQQFSRCRQSAGKKQGSVFLTPMIAVAGSVADHVLQSMLCGTLLRRAYVNNGGDIALWLAEGERFSVGICDNVDAAYVGSQVELQAQHGIGGVATSGWRGRSYSLGIADAVTVLAGCAADADTAATLIANAVDLPGDTCIQRQPASALSPDSDLGSQAVTVAVDHLNVRQVTTALERGRRYAQSLLSEGLIAAAYLSLQGEAVICRNATHTNSLDVTRVNPPAGAMYA